VRFLDRLVRAFQPFWPAPAAEASLRAELLGRRLDDPAVLVRSLASNAVVPFFLGRCSPAQLDAAHLRLDAADALARAHQVPLGRELVQLHRSLIWLATSAVRARRTGEAGLAGFARHGLQDSYDGTVARTYYVYVLLWKGDDDDALAAMAAEIGRDPPNFVSVAVARAERSALFTRRGKPDEARADLEGLRAQLEGAPPSRLDFLLARTRAGVLVAEGRGAEVVAEAEVHERAARATGAWAVGIDRSAWLELQIDAALQLLRRRALPAHEQARARERARWLVARGVLTFGCLGHRALALLDHAAGRRDAALASLRRALSLSSANSNPYHRWRCLGAARELGVLTLDQETEVAEIGAAGRYVAPPG
jgi:tetratricopeptide (TPR) repeat protein